MIGVIVTDPVLDATERIGGQEAALALISHRQRQVRAVQEFAHLLIPYVPEWWLALVRQYGPWYLTPYVIAWVGADPAQRMQQITELELAYQGPLSRDDLMRRNSAFEALVGFVWTGAL